MLFQCRVFDFERNQSCFLVWIAAFGFQAEESLKNSFENSLLLISVYLIFMGLCTLSKINKVCFTFEIQLAVL